MRLRPPPGFSRQGQKLLPSILPLVTSSGSWGIAAFLGLMVIHSFIPFPAEFLANDNGMVYRSVWGTIITWAGSAMVGAFLAFAFSRKYGRLFVRRMQLI